MYAETVMAKYWSGHGQNRKWLPAEACCIGIIRSVRMTPMTAYVVLLCPLPHLMAQAEVRAQLTGSRGLWS